MAEANIVAVTSIYGYTKTYAITTAGVVVANNTASSNKLYKINLLSISNVDCVNDATVTVQIRTAVASSPVARHLVKTVTVPAESTLIVIDKNTSLYLEEDMDIKVLASTAGDLEAICSYDVIDDA